MLLFAILNPQDKNSSGIFGSECGWQIQLFLLPGNTYNYVETRLKQWCTICWKPQNEIQRAGGDESMLSFLQFLIVRKPCLLNGNKASSHEMGWNDLSGFQGLFSNSFDFFFLFVFIDEPLRYFLLQIKIHVSQSCQTFFFQGSNPSFQMRVQGIRYNWSKSEWPVELKVNTGRSLSVIGSVSTISIQCCECQCSYEKSSHCF